MNPNNNFKRQKGVKQVILTAFMLTILLGTTAAGSLAYLMFCDNPVVNNVLVGKVSCQVEENFDGTVKTQVRVKNTGNTSAYLRCALTITLKDSSGNVFFKAPIEGEQYVLQQSSGSGWQKIGNYYYWLTPVPPKQSTGVFIEECYPIVQNIPENLFLSVEISAQAIQSSPNFAAEQAWGISVDKGEKLP